ncbi:DNA-deoxyinosine glycosylase [Desulfosporosinus sp. BG]|uniref:DNA-deoxyinosine glycosylase n=1 Tax=Desulfosporosinus sp. BG TaxID=1633135 RepID=UPI000839F4D4|nr:DNA-deoxyinosine glycosylase [Desulfosporosinus sp. BG]ODA39360.1 G:T/U mismatch-specific uracil/thymine DNA-glycosylase [Desulfosporosinus sp. BG]
MSLLRSFPPIVEEQSRVLILGSMPGVESLRLQQYYANPRNQFWKIIFALFDLEPVEEYEERTRFLRSQRIALWDVIKMCSREGSLDSKIREEQVNDFSSLFKKYPQIKAVMFNGGKAFETYKKWIGFSAPENVTFHKLTSTSPANTKKYEEKLREWCVLRNLLEGATDL